MVSHWRIIVGFSQSAPAVCWGSAHFMLVQPRWIELVVLVAWINAIAMGPMACTTTYFLRQYSQNYYEKDYSRCHKDACVQISIGNTKCLLGYKGASYSCSSSEKACLHRKCWLGETPLGLSSQPSIDMYCTTTINQATATRAPSQYKDHLSRYGDSHVKDKTVARLSYL